MQEVQRGKKRKRLWWWIITVILFWCWWCWSKQFVTRQRTFIEVPPLTHADTCDVLFFTLLIRSHNLPWIVFVLLILISLLETIACQSLSVSLLSISSKSLLLHTLGLVHFLLLLFHFFLFISYFLFDKPPILPHSCAHTLYQSFLSFSIVMLK